MSITGHFNGEAIIESMSARSEGGAFQRTSHFGAEISPDISQDSAPNITNDLIAP